MQCPPVPIIPMVICLEGAHELIIRDPAIKPAVIPDADLINDLRFRFSIRVKIKKGGKYLEPTSLFWVQLFINWIEEKT
jgi:hypothetical protein